MKNQDRTRYLLAGVLLLIVGSWLVADIARGLIRDIDVRVRGTG